jgi:hypothetical protein
LEEFTGMTEFTNAEKKLLRERLKALDEDQQSQKFSGKYCKFCQMPIMENTEKSNTWIQYCSMFCRDKANKLIKQKRWVEKK